MNFCLKSQSHCKYSEIQTVMNYCGPVTRVSIGVTTSCFITCKLVHGEDHIVPNKQLAVLPCAFHNLFGEKFIYLYKVLQADIYDIISE